jgi:hypothetical protein
MNLTFLGTRGYESRLPLLENPTPSKALTEGGKLTKITEFDTEGKQEKILFLKEIEIFPGLSPSELTAIAGVTEEKAYEENEEVIKQNSAGETVSLFS